MHTRVRHLANSYAYYYVHTVCIGVRVICKL